MTPQQITLVQMMAQTVTVHWGVQVPAGCTGVTQTLNGGSVDRVGIRTDPVVATIRYVSTTTSMSGGTATST